MTDLSKVKSLAFSESEVRSHAFAKLFPLLQGSALTAFNDDVRQNGVREPIVFYRGELLDGRNRLAAARAANAACPFVEYQGDDPLGFVISKNLQRRHLKEAQRALIAARMTSINTRGRGQQPSGLTRAEAAELLKVSKRSVNAAAAILKRGSEALIEAIENGKASIHAGSIIADMPEAKQGAIVASGPRHIVAIAHAKKPLSGTRGRSQYANLWAQVDEIVAALEASELGTAGLAASKLATSITNLVRQRKAA